MNPSSSECGNCGSRETKIPLHNVRLRGIYRKLCTHCVLKLHSSSFCPLCFSLHDSTSPPLTKRCSKCSSFTHSHCATSHPPQSPFLCPPCSDNAFTFFKFPENGVIDKRLASILLCAAKIAALSMGKAVVAARAEAERRVKEAAVSRKKAREALENVTILVGKQRNGGSINKLENSVLGNNNNNNGLVVLHNGNLSNNGSTVSQVGVKDAGFQHSS